MGHDHKYYDVDEYNDWKRGQGSHLRGLPRPNFVAAAHYIKNFFDGKEFGWAALGGLAMLCLGHRREMSDIHIVYDVADYRRMKLNLEKDKRVTLPKGMNPLLPTKVLLNTGSATKDAGCTQVVDVEVNLVPSGSLGTPRNDLLRKNQVLLRLNLDGKMNNFKCLNILYLIRSSLSLCKNKDLAWEPRDDIAFLCTSYPREIEAIRSQLDPTQLHELFFSTAFFSRLSKKDQETCSVALLGKQHLGISESTVPSVTVTDWPGLEQHVSENTLQEGRYRTYRAGTDSEINRSRGPSAIHGRSRSADARLSGRPYSWETSMHPERQRSPPRVSQRYYTANLAPGPRQESRGLANPAQTSPTTRTHRTLSEHSASVSPQASHTRSSSQPESPTSFGSDLKLTSMAQLTPLTGQLRVVGPEGVYPLPRATPPQSRSSSNHSSPLLRAETPSTPPPLPPLRFHAVELPCSPVTSEILHRSTPSHSSNVHYPASLLPAFQGGDTAGKGLARQGRRYYRHTGDSLLPQVVLWDAVADAQVSNGSFRYGETSWERIGAKHHAHGSDVSDSDGEGTLYKAYSPPRVDVVASS